MADEQIRILFLAANPKTTAPLDLQTEFNEIESVLGEARDTKHILLQQRWKLSRDQLLDHLLRYKPHVVHFSGHGTEDHLLLQDADGNAWPIDRTVVREAFRSAGHTPRLVVLNACFSRDVAEELSEVVDCVIGMAQPVYDSTAVKFAAALYRGLGEGLSIREAFDRARAQIMVSGLEGPKVPQILSKPGLDPRNMFMRGWIKLPDPARNDVTPSSISPRSAPIDRPSVRKALDRAFRDDASFEQFVLDYFPDVSRRYASGMDRVQKTNLLLTLKEPAEVFAALQSSLQD